jgi:riboflavin biosynthesis pyrimidine reductase
VECSCPPGLVTLIAFRLAGTTPIRVFFFLATFGVLNLLVMYAATNYAADVLVAGERDVDLHAALQCLGEVGHRSVLAEGGPSFNAQLAAADLVDELCPTITPRLVGGDSRRILTGAPAGMAGFVLHSVCEDAGYLFLRLRLRRAA